MDKRNYFYRAGGNVNYASAHARCQSEWGKASQHKCNLCGNTADEWSYDGTDTSEKTHVIGNGYKMFYSVWPEFYRPLCIRCHRAVDFAVEVCSKGHELKEGNLYIDRSRPNRNICLTCRRDRDRTAKRAARARK